MVLGMQHHMSDYRHAKSNIWDVTTNCIYAWVWRQGLELLFRPTRLVVDDNKVYLLATEPTISRLTLHIIKITIIHFIDYSFH